MDRERGVIEVYRRADGWNASSPPKSEHGYRTLQMPSPVRETLRLWLESHEHEPVFPSRAGTPLNHQNLLHHCGYPLLRHAAARRLDIKSCRHWFASRMIEEAATLKELQEKGATTTRPLLRTTATCSRATDEARKAPAERLVLA